MATLLAAPLLGRPVARIDGLAKVTGTARFPSDVPLANLAHACLVTSSIARGRITGFNLDTARTVRGVLAILTYQNVGDRVRPVPHLMKGGQVNSTSRPLSSAEIRHSGQIVAMVVAESVEIAQHAARRVQVSYQEDVPAATFDAAGAERVSLAQLQPEQEDLHVGNAAGAWETAAAKIDAAYVTPPQHHNPMELFTTTCAWDGPRLTIYEPTRFVMGVKFGIAKQLGLDPANVRVVAQYLGGHFGSKLSLSQHTALVALAARDLGRPVKLVSSRKDGFTIATFRPETRHRVRLGADSAGRLIALVHEAEQVTSRTDDISSSGTEVSARLYACPNISTHVDLVRVDRNTPGPMRAPPEVPYLFALESAMDELAVALQMDPIELRRVNDTDHEPIKNLPYSSRPLMRCFDAAAQAFGWKKRDPRPRAMSDGDWLIGWGCASAMRPTQISAAAVRLRLQADGTALVQTAHHEIGNGATTVVAVTVADLLGISLDRIRVEFGDTNFPPASVSGGSTTTTSLCHAVTKAAEELRRKLSEIVSAAADGPLAGQDPMTLNFHQGSFRSSDGRAEPLSRAIPRSGSNALEVLVENNPPDAPPENLEKLRTGRSASAPKSKEHLSAAFGAQFVEVRVHAATGELRVARMVGAYASGRIVNSLTARSQMLGGMVWGLSSALLEATEIDPRSAHYMNADFEKYLVPVCADVPEPEIIFVPDDDRQVNPLGIKGLGELGLIGVNAAIANAVYHATGRRIRSLPIRIEDVI